MTAPAPLTLADQAFANVLGWLVANVIQDLETEAMMLDALVEVLPSVNRRHPRLKPMAEAADQYLIFRDGWKDRRGLGQAKFLSAAPMADFLKWRAGLALDAFRERAATDDAA